MSPHPLLWSPLHNACSHRTYQGTSTQLDTFHCTAKWSGRLNCQTNHLHRAQAQLLPAGSRRQRGKGSLWRWWRQEDSSARGCTVRYRQTRRGRTQHHTAQRCTPSTPRPLQDYRNPPHTRWAVRTPWDKRSLRGRHWGSRLSTPLDRMHPLGRCQSTCLTPERCSLHKSHHCSEKAWAHQRVRSLTWHDETWRAVAWRAVAWHHLHDGAWRGVACCGLA